MRNFNNQLTVILTTTCILISVLNPESPQCSIGYKTLITAQKAQDKELILSYSGMEPDGVLIAKPNLFYSDEIKNINSKL